MKKCGLIFFMPTKIDQLLAGGYEAGGKLHELLAANPEALRQLTREQILEIGRRSQEFDYWGRKIAQLLLPEQLETLETESDLAKRSREASPFILRQNEQSRPEPARSAIAKPNVQMDSFAGASLREFDAAFGQSEHENRHAYGRARAAFAQQLIQQLPKKIKIETDLGAIRKMVQDLRAAAKEGTFRGTYDGYVLHFEPCEIDADLDEILVDALVRLGHEKASQARLLKSQIDTQDFTSGGSHEKATKELEGLLQEIFEPKK